MSEITQPPPDLKTQDTNARVNRLNAASDQHTQQNSSTEQKTSRSKTEVEPEKTTTHHDPAVTLASTLSRLDSGSYLKATVEGVDSEGRTIITSELGTYLVTPETKNIEEFKKEEFNNLQKDTALEIRILAIDKEIKAEIIRSATTGDEVTKSFTIPVKLTLTELTKHIDNLSTPKSSTVYSQTPLDDIKSQYQVTTLYRAERIAREIADKLENLPLPTSSPNYRVYGSSPSQSASIENQGPKLSSTNIFIQEVSNNPNIKPSTAQPISNIVLEQILGQNINVQVIKALPKEPSPLLAGLPDAVIKEITAFTPLDYVSAGQTLNINVAALAIPYAVSPQNISDNPVNIKDQNIQSNTVIQTPTSKIINEATNAPPIKDTYAAPQVKDAIISGIIIDTSRTAEHGASNIAPHQSRSDITSADHSTPYSQKNGPQSFIKSDQLINSAEGKNYYLATPTSVLKFKSEVPLIPGTIVSFTVQPNSTLPQQTTAEKAVSATKAENTANTINNTNTPTSSNVSVESPVSTNPLPINILNKIETLPSQDLDQLPQEWGSISLALATLNASSANIAAILASRIPNMQNPEQLTSTMFFFLSAIKSSHPARTWLGPDVSDRIRQLGAGKLLDHIDSDLTRISRLSTDRPTGEWRPHLVPMHNGQDISAIPILTKQIISDEDKNHKNQNDKNDIKIKATRFILELNFSQFGSVLIDGLLKGTRLDLILKSVKPMPHTVKIKLIEQYNDALKKNAFEGEMIINDNVNIDISVRKIIESMVHKTSIEKKI